jgi:hypothetical protein
MVPALERRQANTLPGQMEDPLSFSDLLLALSPLLAALWLWGLGHVLRDLRRVSATGPELARCGLPEQPLSPTPLQRWLASRRSRPRLPSGLPAR